MATLTVQDRIAAEFAHVETELIHTNLSAEDETKLREAFGA